MRSEFTFPDDLDDTDLAKYQKVNRCETYLELAEAIRSFADKDGKIRSIRYSSKKWDALLMADFCENFTVNVTLDKDNANFLTRDYGIRQQALYIHYYTCLDTI